MEHENLMKNAENLIEGELAHARSKFSNLNSSHEGYAVILEEFEELQEEIDRFEQKLQSLWKAIRSNEGSTQYEDIKLMEDISRHMIKEGIQLSAMCKRFREDLFNDISEGKSSTLL